MKLYFTFNFISSLFNLDIFIPQRINTRNVCPAEIVAAELFVENINRQRLRAIPLDGKTFVFSRIRIHQKITDDGLPAAVVPVNQVDFPAIR